jgi:VanZ family protein
MDRNRPIRSSPTGIPPVRTAILTLVQSTPIRIMLPVAWMGLIFALSHQPTLPYPQDLDAKIVSTLGHVTVYAVLAALVWWALGSTGVSGSWRVALAVAVAVLYGVTDEWHQSFVPGRTPDVRDIVADTTGAVLAMVVVTWLARRGVIDANR